MNQTKLIYSVGAATKDETLLEIARRADRAFEEIGKAQLPTDIKDRLIVEAWKKAKPRFIGRMDEIRKELEAEMQTYVPIRERADAFKADPTTVAALGSLDHERLRKTLLENPTDANIAAVRKLEEIGKVPRTLLDILDAHEKGRIERENEAAKKELRSLDFVDGRLESFEKGAVAPAEERLQRLQSAQANVDSILRGL